MTIIPDFDGKTYDRPLDQGRLADQLGKVHNLMADGHWRTLAEISDAIGGDSTASVSARIRDLRKPKFGGFEVLRRRRGEESRGLFEYSLQRATSGAIPLHSAQTSARNAPKLSRTDLVNEIKRLQEAMARCTKECPHCIPLQRCRSCMLLSTEIARSPVRFE